MTDSGNMTSKALNGTTTAIGVNAATNQISPRASSNYDWNGNMTSGVGMTMQYDVANRLLQAQLNSGSSTEYYGYAPDNKRVYKYSTVTSGETWTFWGAQGENPGDVSVSGGGAGRRRRELHWGYGAVPGDGIEYMV